MSLLSAAASMLPTVLDAVLPSQHKDSDQSVALPPSGQPISSSDSVVLSNQPLPPAPTPSPTYRVGPGAGVVIPFQYLFYEYNGTQKGVVSMTLEVMSPVAAIIKPYRDCVVLNLDAVVFPTSYAYKNPATFDLAWTTADVTPSESEILHTPGATKVTVGSIHLMSTGVITANLSYINPIIKAPITYNNSPRFNIRFYPQDIENTPVVAAIIIRGSIRCSHPILSAH